MGSGAGFAPADWEKLKSRTTPQTISADFLAAIARSKGREPAGDIAEIKHDEILAISAQINPKKEPDVIPEPVIAVSGGYQIGERVPNKGIYFGVWDVSEPISQLKKKFNMFAAEDDFKDGDILLTNIKIAKAEYNKIFAQIRNAWNYEKDELYKDHIKLKACLLNGLYQGEWFIPPIEILTGKDSSGAPVLVPNLKMLKKSENFAPLHGSYWSCTKAIKKMMGTDYESRYVGKFGKNVLIDMDPIDSSQHTHKVRLVRAELIP